MEEILIFRAELKRLGRVTLLKMAFSQKEKRCVLSGLCPFYLSYKGRGFCISEILGEGCQEERLRRLCPEEERPEITRESGGTPELPIRI
jgi:hypothetical protein